jgi:carbamoyl-phosphate synthase large subunit
MKQFNILVTGVGAIIGYGIINSLRMQKDYNVRILGQDIYENAYGRFLCDKFYVAERADSPHFLEYINRIIEDEHIDLIIPGIEQDMYRLYELREKVNTTIVLNNDLLIDLSRDKLKTYDFFKENGLNVIPTMFMHEYDSCVENLGLPFLLKPRKSYASKGIHKIYTKEEFDFYNKIPENNIFQRIVGSEDEEYTIGVFGKGDGTYSDYIILKRTLAQTGATDKAVVIENDEPLMSYVNQICNITKPLGPTNIQLRKENGKMYLLEINPRISSACSIRAYAGYNDSLKSVALYLEGKHLPNSPKKIINAVRFVGDFFYE